jgi:hypothetical protein
MGVGKKEEGGGEGGRDANLKVAIASILLRSIFLLMKNLAGQRGVRRTRK